MVDEKLFEALAKLRDNFNGAALALDELIQSTSKTVLRTYDVSKIKWESRTGERGPFELATKKNNENNSDYVGLQDHLKEKNSIINVNGMMYWLFTNGDAIGRKPQTKKA